MEISPFIEGENSNLVVSLDGGRARMNDNVYETKRSSHIQSRINSDISNIRRILLGQRTNFITEFQEQLLPTGSLLRRVLIEALGVTDALSSRFNHALHQLGYALVAIQFRQQIFHDPGIGWDTSKIHKSERPRECCPIAKIISECTIDVTAGGISGLNEVERLSHQGVHKAVSDEATYIALHICRFLCPELC